MLSSNTGALLGASVSPGPAVFNSILAIPHGKERFVNMHTFCLWIDEGCVLKNGSVSDMEAA
jgi:hypothetical protein